MTIFTMKTDGTDVQPRTFTKDMNWAPFIAPDGQHFFYDRVFEDNNWEIVMNDLAGGEPVRITWNKGFDGFVSMSWDGKKALFGRSTGQGLHVESAHLRDGHLLAQRRARRTSRAASRRGPRGPRAGSKIRVSRNSATGSEPESVRVIGRRRPS